MAIRTFLCVLMMMPLICHGQKTLSLTAKNGTGILSEIDTFFSPPSTWENDYGNYRSPLVFYNGDTVTTAEEWKLRRQEIRQRWMNLMGEWPPFLEDQTLTITDSISRENFMQYTVEFDWIPQQKTRGYLLVPNEIKDPAPAVITVFYEPETAIGQSDKTDRDFALQLARRGFVTLSLGTTEASEAQTYALYYPDIDHAEVQPLSMLAYAAANAWHVLAKHPKVDDSRIGIVGHSFGGKWAMFASCLFDRFAFAAWSDPGIVFQQDRPSINYWEPWYLGYHPKPWRKRGLITEENPAYGLYPKLIREGYDLTELHALMAPRPFFVSGGEEDPPSRWQALNHTVQINQLLGHEKRVAMHNRPDHSPNEESNRILYQFMEYFSGL